MLPDNLVFVLNLIGFNWPQADEDKLRQSAQHWREYASELEYVIKDSNRILDQIRTENSGESIQALEPHWRQFGDHLRQAQAAAGLVAEGLDGFAAAVEVLKGAVLLRLGILAGELAATTGAAFLTFGVAEAAAPEEIVITQGIMRWLSREAIQKAEHLVAEKISKAVAEHFLSIKNGLKALKAAPTALKDFGKGLVKSGAKDLEHGAGSLEREGSDLAGSIRHVNPTGGTENCLECAIVTDKTLKGKGVKEVARNIGPQPVRVLETRFGSKFQSVPDRAGIEAILKKSGPRSTGIVFGSRGPNAIGHVFNAVNQKGVIRFLDGQIGREASFEGFGQLFFLKT
jgi:Papain fold toxin 1, glutamine deamidase